MLSALSDPSGMSALLHSHEAGSMRTAIGRRLMDAKTLAQYALLVLKQIERFQPVKGKDGSLIPQPEIAPHDRQAILHVAQAIVAVQIAEAQRPPMDERL